MKQTLIRGIFILLLSYIVYKKRYHIIQLLIGIASLRHLLLSQSHVFRHLLDRIMDRQHDERVRDY